MFVIALVSKKFETRAGLTATAFIRVPILTKNRFFFLHTLL